MSDRKFTDDEVIKALECCEEHKKDCSVCPSWLDCMSNDMPFLAAALALINRQKAEIERLRKYYFTHDYHECHNEAIKEFAERLKATPVRFASITCFGNPPIMGKKVLYVDDNDIDNLVKEMTEGGERE